MYDSYPVTREQADDFALDPETEEMIASGLVIREQGGQAYVDALQEEREADIHGTTADTPRFVGVAEFPVLNSTQRQSKTKRQTIREMNNNERLHIERARRLRMGIDV